MLLDTLRYLAGELALCECKILYRSLCLLPVQKDLVTSPKSYLWLLQAVCYWWRHHLHFDSMSLSLGTQYAALCSCTNYFYPAPAFLSLFPQTPPLTQLPGLSASTRVYHIPAVAIVCHGSSLRSS
jgi:hypothetical protein